MYTKLIACGFNNESFPLYEGSEKHLRSFTYVGDIVDGVVSVIGKEEVVDGEIINIGTEAEHTTQEGIEAAGSARRSGRRAAKQGRLPAGMRFGAHRHRISRRRLVQGLHARKPRPRDFRAPRTGPTGRGSPYRGGAATRRLRHSG